MEVVFVVLLVFGIVSFIAPFFHSEKISKYVKARKGKLISTKLRGRIHTGQQPINREFDIKYRDKHNNLRAVTLYYVFMFSSFGEDIIEEYDTDSPEYKELRHQEIEAQNAFDAKAKEFEPKYYELEDGKELMIKQEFPNPNIGEFAFVKGKPAPTGKYKLGFLNHVIIVYGRVANELPEIEKPIKKVPEIIEPIYKKQTYECAEGELVIEQEYHNPNIGEIAYLNGKPAPTGKYKIGFMRSVFISDGKVDKES